MTPAPGCRYNVAISEDTTLTLHPAQIDHVAAEALPRRRAFVLQLAVDAVPGSGALRGRVVHIDSSEAVTFENAGELYTFLRSALEPTGTFPSPAQADPEVEQ